MSPEHDLETVRALIRRVAGDKAGTIFSAADLLVPDPEEECEIMWDRLARLCPEEFGDPDLDPDDSTALGLAFRYARHHRLAGAGRLVLTEEQQEGVDRARAILCEWSELETWHDFEHFVFDDECAELAATWRLRNSGLGVSFTFHPGLDQAALYCFPDLAPYLADDVWPNALAAIVLHEEAHLASAATAGGRGAPDEETDSVFELFGRLAEVVAYIAAVGDTPDRELVEVNAEDHGESELVELLARFPSDVELRAIVRAMAELAVAAARSSHEFAAAEKRIFG